MSCYVAWSHVVFAHAVRRYGIDGNWSSFAALVGVGGQLPVYLSVATALSEIWVVQTYGCTPGRFPILNRAVPCSDCIDREIVQLCITGRGGVFDTSQSSNWKPLGPFQLGVNNTGTVGNADYGLDMISFYNFYTKTENQYNNVLIGAMNDTEYYQGFIGVGVNEGRFNKNLTLPLISQMARTYGTIPSHSYGYTAGAYYRHGKFL